jgi:hypothetical protein
MSDFEVRPWSEDGAAPGPREPGGHDYRRRRSPARPPSAPANSQAAADNGTTFTSATLTSILVLSSRKQLALPLSQLKLPMTEPANNQSTAPRSASATIQVTQP